MSIHEPHVFDGACRWAHVRRAPFGSPDVSDVALADDLERVRIVSDSEPDLERWWHAPLEASFEVEGSKRVIAVAAIDQLPTGRAQMGSWSRRVRPANSLPAGLTQPPIPRRPVPSSRAAFAEPSRHTT